MAIKNHSMGAGDCHGVNMISKTLMQWVQPVNLGDEPVKISMGIKIKMSGNGMT